MRLPFGCFSSILTEVDDKLPCMIPYNSQVSKQFEFPMKVRPEASDGDLAKQQRHRDFPKATGCHGEGPQHRYRIFQDTKFLRVRSHHFRLIIVLFVSKSVIPLSRSSRSVLFTDLNHLVANHEKDVSVESIQL